MPTTRFTVFATTRPSLWSRLCSWLRELLT
jgi:hypothetical protein